MSSVTVDTAPRVKGGRAPETALISRRLRPGLFVRSHTLPPSVSRGDKLATLHIEHPITDLNTWVGAFERFEDARRKAGVRAQRVWQPVDDDQYIYVALDFDTV